MRLHCLISFVFVLSGLANSTTAEAARLHSERWYQDQYCQGDIEYSLPDKTRIDCLTNTHAIEYDFADKWAEAIGQSLHYAFQTNKKAGIALIIEDWDRDKTYFYRLNSLIIQYKLPIDVVQIRPDG